MIISEFLQEGTNKKCRPRILQIECDNCLKEYKIDYANQNKGFKKYNIDLCQSCKQLEQYKTGERSKDQCYKGGEASKKKMKGKIIQDLYLKIFYKDFNEINKTYVADFLINEKYLVEIKPKTLHKSKIIQRKKEAANIFCKEKKLIYKLLDSPILTREKITKLYKTNQIKFIKRYEPRVINYLQI